MRVLVLVSVAAAWFASIVAMVAELETLPNPRTGPQTVVRVSPK